MISNCVGLKISRNELSKMNSIIIEKLFNNRHHVTSARCLTEVTGSLTRQIKKIEKEVLQEIKLKKEYKKLLAVSGIGKILGLTITLETGDIGRFSHVGDYSSFCRCVPSRKVSNGKNKGSGNKKNGNRYLAWAYMEAAHHMVCHSTLARK